MEDVLPPFLTTGCVLTCAMGDAPMPFIAMELPGKPVVNGGFTVAAIDEIVPFDNVPSFVMCNSPENPEVIAATAAAMGVLTPMPCVPVIVDPWEPPAEGVSFDGVPLATIESKCLCAWGGEITIDVPAEETVTAL